MKIYLDTIQESDSFISKCVNDYLEHDRFTIYRINSKPYIKCDNQDVYVSLAHSADLIVCAISNKNIGIDVETVIEKNYDRLAKRFFEQNEAESVNRNGYEEFYTLWTMKEAYTKLRGTNLNTRITKEKIQGEGLTINHIRHKDYIICVISEESGEIILV